MSVYHNHWLEWQGGKGSQWRVSERQTCPPQSGWCRRPSLVEHNNGFTLVTFGYLGWNHLVKWALPDENGQNFDPNSGKKEESCFVRFSHRLLFSSHSAFPSARYVEEIVRLRECRGWGGWGSGGEGRRADTFCLLSSINPWRNFCIKLLKLVCLLIGCLFRKHTGLSRPLYDNLLDSWWPP